jgi:phage gp46-like protein
MSRYVDPKTGAYVDGPNGTWKEGDELEMKIAFSLENDLGAWEGDPQLGNELFTLERETAGPGTAQRLKDLVKRALQWLIDEGELETVEVDVELVENTDGIFYAFEARSFAPGRAKPIVYEGLQVIGL